MNVYDNWMRMIHFFVTNCYKAFIIVYGVGTIGILDG